MKAKQLASKRHVFSDGISFAEIIVWRLPKPVPGSHHLFKYSLAYVYNEICVLRYDNERGKGDHLHLGKIEEMYLFCGIDALLSDFSRDIKRWRDENGKT